ncbi:type II secretion system protein, partial [bacterium]|nr:type II secretion system protein [bacterium]
VLEDFWGNVSVNISGEGAIKNKILRRVPNYNQKFELPTFIKVGKKAAFTLAEVLVTLGIVGIVAAMTLPMLAKNYQFYVRQQQFKKAYAALNIASQKTQIDFGEGVQCYQPDVTGNTNRSHCAYFFNELIKNLQLAQVCEGDALEKGCLGSSYRTELLAEKHGWNVEQYKSGCSGWATEHIEKEAIVYVSSSGFLFIPYTYGGGDRLRPNKYTAPIILLDVNGKKGPNKWGHDVMVLHYYKRKPLDSVFQLRAHTGCMVLDEGGYYTTHFMEYLYGQNAEL